MPKYRWPPQMRLKLYMVERGVTTTWLAETVGLSVVTTTGILTGRVRPTPRTRALIAETLGEPAGSLFTNVEDPTDDELADAAEPERWGAMPPIDAETRERLWQLLFPRPAVGAGGRRA